MVTYKQTCPNLRDHGKMIDYKYLYYASSSSSSSSPSSFNRSPFGIKMDSMIHKPSHPSWLLLGYHFGASTGLGAAGVARVGLSDAAAAGL
ncbi:hypothetical protein QYF36_004659 [Acer negundo]|nr:hypothetical protein QYF36_004659 [Acer negundo]